MGNGQSFSYRPSVDIMLRLAHSRIKDRVGDDANVQVVLVLEEGHDAFVLFADIRDPIRMQNAFEWFLVEGGTGKVMVLASSDLCGPVTRSRKLYSSSSLLGEMAKYTNLPTQEQMKEFVDLCISPVPPQQQTLTEVSESA